MAGLVLALALALACCAGELLWPLTLGPLLLHVLLTSGSWLSRSAWRIIKHDPMFDQELAEAADLGLEIIHSSEHPFPGFWFSLLVVVLALGLAVPSALDIIGLILRLTSAGYVPLGRAHSGGEEGLMKSSICRLPLLRWENIPEPRKQIGEVDVVTTLDLPVHVGQES